MASRVNTGSELRALHEYRGAHTDLRDLIRLRYAAREITDLADNKTSNPLAGLLTSNFRGRGIDFAEVRIYQPGDDVRTIDWRVTARTQVAHTKLFQEEKERPVLILVDQSASMYFGSQVTFKSVLAARTAALIAWAALEHGDRVGGIVFSEQGHREVRPRRNKHALLRLLNEVNDFNHALRRDAGLPEENPENDFTEALAEVRRVTRQGSVIFIISDFNHFTDESQRHLQPLAQSGDLVGVHISDPLEQHLPTPDVYAITNGRERSRINTGNHKHREAYQLGYQQQLAAIQEAFMRVKSPLLMLNTSQSIVDGLNRQSAAVN